jgi:protein gp37
MTGPGAVPIHPDWVRSVRDKCKEAGVPFFFKSWGEWATVANIRMSDPLNIQYEMRRVGKKLSGDRIDGVQYHEFPSERSLR